MTDNTQELDEIIQHCNYMETTGEPGICHWCGERQTSDLHTLKKLILDWHNKQVKNAVATAEDNLDQYWNKELDKQIEEVLDRLENGGGGVANVWEAIEAERKKLKENE